MNNLFVLIMIVLVLGLFARPMNDILLRKKVTNTKLRKSKIITSEEFVKKNKKYNKIEKVLNVINIAEMIVITFIMLRLIYSFFEL